MATIDEVMVHLRADPDNKARFSGVQRYYIVGIEPDEVMFKEACVVEADPDNDIVEKWNPPDEVIAFSSREFLSHEWTLE